MEFCTIYGRDITQKSCVALFPLWSLKTFFVRADVNQQKHTKKIHYLTDNKYKNNNNTNSDY